jgi:hypothetical protein
MARSIVWVLIKSLSFVHHLSVSIASLSSPAHPPAAEVQSQPRYEEPRGTGNAFVYPAGENRTSQTVVSTGPVAVDSAVDNASGDWRSGATVGGNTGYNSQQPREYWNKIMHARHVMSCKARLYLPLASHIAQ